MAAKDEVQIIYLNDGMRHWGHQPSDYEARSEIKITVITHGITGLQTETQCHLLRAPCVAITPPYLRHCFIGPDEPVEMMVAVLLNVREPWYSRLLPQPVPQFFAIDAAAIETLQQLHRHCQQERTRRDALPATSALMLSWLTIILRARCGEPSFDTALRLKSVPEAISARIGETILVRDLAREIGLSETTFRRRYHSYFGCAPKRTLHEARLLHAANLLTKSDLKVQSVAHACGFATVQSFSRFFRQQMGVSPAKWRALPPMKRWTVRDLGNKKTDSGNKKCLQNLDKSHT